MDLVKELDKELKQFQQEMTRLKTAVEHISEAKEAASKAVDSVGELKESLDQYAQTIKNQQEEYSVRLESPIETYQALSTSASQLSDRLQAVNFPDRLDKIETVVKDTVDELRSSRERLKLEADYLRDKSEGMVLELKNRIKEFEEKQEKFLDEYSKRLEEVKSEIIRSGETRIEELSSSFSNLITTNHQIVKKMMIGFGSIGLISIILLLILLFQ